MPLTVFTQTNFAAHFLPAKSIFYRETTKLSTLRPPLGGLGAKYAVHHRLYWKALTELPLVIIELFSLSPTVEPLRANID